MQLESQLGTIFVEPNYQFLGVYCMGISLGIARELQRSRVSLAHTARSLCAHYQLVVLWSRSLREYLYFSREPAFCCRRIASILLRFDISSEVSYFIGVLKFWKLKSRSNVVKKGCVSVVEYSVGTKFLS